MSNQISNVRIVRKNEFLNISVCNKKSIEGFNDDKLQEKCGILEVTQTPHVIRFSLVKVDGNELVHGVLAFEVDNIEKVKADMGDIFDEIEGGKHINKGNNFGIGLRWLVEDKSTYVGYVGIVLRHKRREAAVAFPTRNKQLDQSFKKIVFCEYENFILSLKALFGLE